MKRKDWRIKKLKKDIFGNFFKIKPKKKSKYKIKNIKFLRKLFLRKNRNLIKKNTVKIFFYFKKLLNSNYFFKNKFLNKFNNNVSLVSIKTLPVFLIKKKIFNDFYNFNIFLKLNRLDYFFFKNYNYIKNKKGLEINIFSNNNSQKNNITEKTQKTENDDLILMVKSQKINDNISNLNIINFYLNYNLYILNIIEIYKILIILHFNSINK